MHEYRDKPPARTRRLLDGVADLLSAGAPNEELAHTLLAVGFTIDEVLRITRAVEQARAEMATETR